MKRSTAIFVSGLAFASCVATPPPVPYSSGPDSLLPPVRITAAGEYIDTSDDIAHSGPTLIDMNGDGGLDLLVGCFRGTAKVYLNTATEGDPIYAAGYVMEANGEEMKIPNW